MRRMVFWAGWLVLLTLPIVYGVQIYIAQELPRVALWMWIIPCAATAAIYFSRDTDDVLKHHVV
jgi:hypothetical protein